MKSIFLQWIPAYCGVTGIEKANQLAKKGISIIQHRQRAQSFQSGKLITKGYMNNVVKLQYKTASKNEV